MELYGPHMVPALVSVYPGFVVPTPTFPFAPTKRAVDPVVVWALNTLPVPNCLTVSAFDETALPVTRTADEFIRVGTAVPEFWLNVLIYSLGRFVWGTGGLGIPERA
jgi:hypothetical protein